ncbi:hypothetical protein QZH41_002451 [Actinostola sp. cb2023]|nr:hypothetical protein QZH41_002451 [Actinostola sp. cb2023]
MPAKSTKYGIKVWMAADSSNGYVLNFNTYLGREIGQSLTHGLGYHVVTRLNEHGKSKITLTSVIFGRYEFES